jgi:1-acyl-sn-glycerol-3-phosphate acyltransferase
MRISPIELARQLFFVIVVKPLVLVLIGFNIRHLDRLKAQGPHFIAANHNSHLDSLVVMSLFSFSDIPKVKLVAAKDYWCRNRLLTWFSINIIGIVPIERKVERGSDPLAPILKALDEGYTIVIFPEGSRGEPEQRQPLKNGIARVLETRQEITVTPVFMYGLGKALPRGEALFVPFMCEMNIGVPLRWQDDRRRFVTALDQTFSELAQEIAPKPWS